jgi:hypothetical protein
MQTTVIITASITHGAQTFAPGVQLNVPDAVAQQWIDAGKAMAAGGPQVPPEAAPASLKRKTKG